MAPTGVGCTAAADGHHNVFLLLPLDLLLLVLGHLGRLGRLRAELLAEGLSERVVGARRAVGRVSSALWQRWRSNDSPQRLRCRLLGSTSKERDTRGLCARRRDEAGRRSVDAGHIEDVGLRGCNRLPDGACPAEVSVLLDHPADTRVALGAEAAVDVNVLGRRPR